MNIGAIIKKMRIKKQLSQRKLGNLLGVAESTVQYWENENVELGGKKLIRLMKILEINLQDFPEDQDLGQEVTDGV